MPALSKAGKTSGGGGAFKNVEGILIKNIQQLAVISLLSSKRIMRVLLITG
jgi:hypothetical protein